MWQKWDIAACSMLWAAIYWVVLHFFLNISQSVLEIGKIVHVERGILRFCDVSVEIGKILHVIFACDFCMLKDCVLRFCEHFEDSLTVFAVQEFVGKKGKIVLDTKQNL